jgi:hypothetical protein
VALAAAAVAMEVTSELGRAALGHRGKETLVVLAVQMETFLAAAAAVVARVQLVPMELEVSEEMVVRGPHLQLRAPL